MERKVTALLEEAGGGSQGRRCELCVELHGHQLVYNVPTLLKLKEEWGYSRRLIWIPAISFGWTRIL